MVWIPFVAVWICLKVQDRIALGRDGRIVAGLITMIWTTRAPNEWVKYTFTVDGVTLSGKAQIPKELKGRLRESDTILVRFLPANPEINHPDGWEWSVYSYSIIFCLMVITSAISISIMVILLRERRLVRKGVITLGVVTSCKQNKHAIPRIEYEFSTEDGRSFVGSGDSIITEQKGASILVIYLPQNPRRNVPYPPLNYAVEAHP
jgi:hypothetical protein